MNQPPSAMADERHRLVRDNPTEARRYMPDDKPSSSESSLSQEEDKSNRSDTKKSWFKSLSFMEVQLVALLILAVLIIILLAVLIVVIRVSSFRYCTSAACAHQAGVTLAAMNTSANPCNNFYNYACGNWDKAYPAVPGVGKYSGFYRASERVRRLLYQLLRQGSSKVANKTSTSVAKAVTFYNACNNMNQRNALSAKPLLKLISELGGWTITTTPALSTSWDFLTTLVKLSKLGMAYPLSVSITDNPFNSSQHILVLNVGGYFFRQTLILSSDPKYKAAFMAFGTAVAKLLGKTGSTSELNAKLQKVWDFQKDMAAHAMSQLDRRNPQKTNNILTLTQVQKSLIGTSFNFLSFLKRILGYEVKGTDKIIVRDLKLVKYVAEKIRTMNKEVLANYMMLQVVSILSSKLSQPFAAVKLQRKKAIIGSAIMTPTWKYCVALTKSYFPLQLTAMYVDNFFHKKDKTDVKKMVIQIKEAMKHLITKAHWMDSPTRKVALAKLKYLKPSVAYPDNLFDLKKLDELYKSIQLNVSTFFQDYIKIRRESVKEKLARLKKLVDRTKFAMAPITTNAYYSQSTVTIKILAGIITNPFYDHLFYSTSNLGAIGSIIGHEMNHAFDSRGQQFDIHGNLKAWWTQETRKRFKKRTQCFINQYSKYSFHGMKNKGAYTVAENMADNGGMQASLLAFRMYKQRHGLIHGFLPGLPLREKQLFFLAFAQNYCGSYTDAYAKNAMLLDVHSPYPHRVLGVLSNQKEFTEAYQCPAGSRYNPSKRCLLW